MNFSVCMSVYSNDKPTDFFQSVMSIYQQTIIPNEIVLVVDGAISNNLWNIIQILKEEILILKVICLPENRGHAIARQIGLDAAENELIAVMDSDDIALPNRFEKQIKMFEAHPELSVVGGLIHEFIEDVDHIVGTRIVPLNDKEIKRYLKARCPINQMTVMFRKSDVMKAGGYIDWYCEEDYYLWIRLALKGFKFYNIQENLVNVRVGKEMYSRRGGWRYFKSEAKLQLYMWKHDIISIFRLTYNIIGRFIIQVAMPNRMRGFVFQKLFRR